MIFFTAWLATKAIRKAAPVTNRHPFNSVKFSLQGKPMTFSGSRLSEMMADVEVYAA